MPSVADRAPTGAEETLTEIARQLGRISNLLAAFAIKDREDEGEKIAILAAAGFSHAETGRMIGKKPDAVRMVLTRSRNRRRKRRG